ncbi:MAG: GEVED domain-containing protein, partial [Prosthecobacter sp.]
MRSHTSRSDAPACRLPAARFVVSLWVGLVALLMTSVSAQAQTLDFGDFNSFGSASSTVITTLKIGATTDKESAITSNATATGDDITGTDDEDGVTLPTNIIQGALTTMTVNVTNTSGSSAYLNVWIDYNRNGSLADAGEQALANSLIANGTSNTNRTVSFTVPAAASLGVAGVRVRLTSTSSPGPTGTSGNGEVEDNVVNIVTSTDFGDYPSFTSASQRADSALIRIGTAATDTEAANPATGTATVDDTTGTDDEDLTMPAFTVGTATTLSVPITATTASLSGTAARAIVFVDWNGDNDVIDANESLAVQTIVTGTNTLNFSLTPPTGTVPGTKYLRIRVAETTATPAFSGASTLRGEVEDYAITVQPNTDFGDYPSFASASQVSNSLLRIGSVATDAEAVNPTTGTATADDTTGTDDEDLTMPAFTVGTATTLSVPITATLASLSGTAARAIVFVDWNGDNDVIDANESLAVQTIVTGTNTHSFSLTPPTGTVPGTKYLRIRVAETTATPAFSGASTLRGEVEDYAVTVSSNDFGDFLSFGSASSTMNATLKIGTATDAEAAATTNTTATGDDTTGSDDEDGVTLPASIAQSAASSMTVNVTNNSGSSAYLNVWIDFNNNGVLTDSGEQVAANTLIATGTTAANRVVNFTTPGAAVVGTAGVRVRLTSTSTPGATGASGNGEVEDNIVTITVPPILGIGNLVWSDSNDNGRFDTGEGVSGVLVQLLNTSNTVITSASTDSAGLYQLTTTVAGTYYAKIPASEFASGKPLFGKYSRVGDGPDNGKDDDWDENGVDDAAPATNGIRSPNFTLTAGAEPTTGESGTDSSWDNGTTGRPSDANADLTIDFGFASCVQTNLITNGSFETANPTTLTFPDAFPSGGTAIAKTRTTTSNTDVANWSFDAGSYINDPTHATDGSRMVHLNNSGSCAGQQFAVGSVISGLTQLTAGQVYTLTFDWAPFDPSAPNTPPAGNNTQIYTDLYYTNAAWTSSTFVNSFADFQEPKANDFLLNPRPLSTWAALDWRRCRYKFTVPSAPSGQNYLTLFLTAGGSTGKLLLDNVTLTVSCEQAVGTVGNLIFNDANGNRAKDATESGIDKVLVHLYRRPATGAAVWVGSSYTSQGGRYLFSGMQPANYYVWVDSANFSATTPSWWQGGAIDGPLYNKLSSSSNANPNVTAAAASDDDVSEKGVDNAAPITNGIYSPDFALGVGTEPVSSVGGKETGAFNSLDDSVDSHGDMTIDFGFAPATAATDYGDHSLFPLASSTANSGLRIGTVATDAELIPTTNATATGDDTTGTDDEDGVTLPASVAQGVASSMTINVTNSSGSSAYLNVWIDFNNNGVLTDSGEQVAANTLIATGTAAANRVVNFTVPAAAPLGNAGVRVRLSSTSTPGATGASGNGEVEDSLLTIIQAPLSLGNLVWSDADNDGVKDASESGIDGVSVQLFRTTDDIIGNGDDVQQGSNLTTAGGGLYAFTGLPAGKYFVKIPTVPAGLTMSGGVPDAMQTPNGFAENDQNDDNNGIHITGIGTAVTSGLVNLTAGGESVTDGDADAYTNLTIDFGFTAAQSCPTFHVWPDWRTLTRTAPTAGTGWISQPFLVNSSYTAQTFSNVLGTGAAVTVSYTNNMFDNYSPNNYVPRWDSTFNSSPNDVQCNPMFYGGLRFTNNNGDTSASVTSGVGTATGHSRVEITFDKDVLMDDFNLGSIGMIGSAREWAFVRAYDGTGAGVAPGSITGQTVSCDAVVAGTGPSVDNNGAAGAYLGGLDDQNSQLYGNASFVWNTTPIRKIEIQFWRSSNTSIWS